LKAYVLHNITTFTRSTPSVSIQTKWFDFKIKQLFWHCTKYHLICPSYLRYYHMIRP